VSREEKWYKNQRKNPVIRKVGREGSAKVLARGRSSYMGEEKS